MMCRLPEKRSLPMVIKGRSPLGRALTGRRSGHVTWRLAWGSECGMPTPPPWIWKGSESLQVIQVEKESSVFCLFKKYNWCLQNFAGNFTWTRLYKLKTLSACDVISAKTQLHTWGSMNSANEIMSWKNIRSISNEQLEQINLVGRYDDAKSKIMTSIY